MLSESSGKKKHVEPLPVNIIWQPPLPHMQVISEPGAEEALQAQWTNNLIFAEGVDDLKKVIALYVQNETARVEQQTVGWEFAKSHYALEPFIQDHLL